MSTMKRGRWLFLLSAFFIFSGCDRLRSLWQEAPSPEAVSEEKERGLEAIDTVEVLTPNERRRINRLFLREIYEQVYAKRLSDAGFYNSWMNVLEQGASIEGVYRGLILSDTYRQLERGIASKEARDFFAREIAHLEMLKNPKLKNEAAIVQEIAKAAEKSSLFTLKRVLGEKALEAIDARKGDREAMATLFADLSLRWFADGIDLGFKQRNVRDREYFYNWSLRNSRGRIQWEMLNRLHRVMNHHGRILYSR